MRKFVYLSQWDHYMVKQGEKTLVGLVKGTEEPRISWINPTVFENDKLPDLRIGSALFEMLNSGDKEEDYIFIGVTYDSSD